MPSNPKKKVCRSHKVVVVGDCGVGKTSLLHRMAGFERSDGDQKEYYSKVAEVEGAPAPVKVQMWDTAGQEKFGAARLPSSFFRHAQAAILVYDVSDRCSFENIPQWAKQLYEHNMNCSCLLVVVGHKCDVSHANRQVSQDEGLAVATVVGATHFFECSAKSDINVFECFNAIATALVEHASTAP